MQQNGKRDYVQTLKYFPDPKHNGHDIKCVVEHTAYSEVAKNEKINEISRKLELYCKFILFSYLKKMQYVLLCFIIVALI